VKNQSKWYSAYHTSFVWKVLVRILDILSSLTIFLESPSFTVNGHAVCAMRHFVVDARDLISVPTAVYVYVTLSCMLLFNHVHEICTAE